MRLQGLVVFLWYEAGSTAGELGRGPVALKICKYLIYFINLIEASLRMTLDFSSKPREAEMSSLRVPSCAFPTWHLVCGRAPGAAPGSGTGAGVPTAARLCYKPSKCAYKREKQTFHTDSSVFKMRRKQRRVKFVLLSFEITESQSHIFGLAG